MSSSNKPTYYFTGIGFNSAFYEPVSSSVNLSNYYTKPEAMAKFLNKDSADTSNVLETFSSGVRITNGLTVDTIAPTVFASSPTQIGWSQSILVSYTDVALATTSITWTGMSITTGTPLPVGAYLMTLTATTTVSAGITGGTVNAWSSGFIYGSGYNTASRSSLQFINNANNSVIAKVAGQYTQNWSIVLKVSNANYYLAGFIITNIGTTLVGGTMQNAINSYSLTRIG